MWGFVTVCVYFNVYSMYTLHIHIVHHSAIIERCLSCSGLFGQKSAQLMTTLGYLPIYNGTHSWISLFLTKNHGTVGEGVVSVGLVQLLRVLPRHVLHLVLVQVHRTQREEQNASCRKGKIEIIKY